MVGEGIAPPLPLSPHVRSFRVTQIFNQWFLS